MMIFIRCDLQVTSTTYNEFPVSVSSIIAKHARFYNWHEIFRETKKTFGRTEHASSFCFMPSFGTHAFMANKRREWGRLTTNYIYTRSRRVCDSRNWASRPSFSARFSPTTGLVKENETKERDVNGDARREETAGWIFWEETEVKREEGENRG